VTSGKPVSHATDGARTARPVVLIAMRDPIERSAATAALRAWGCATLEAADGVAALRICGRYPRLLAVVVADLLLPTLNGRQLLNALRWARQEVPVLLCGGYQVDEVRERATLAPDTPYLPRPWAVPDLLARVEELMDGRFVGELRLRATREQRQEKQDLP